MSAALFDLTPTEDQQMTQDMVRRFVADVMAPQARAADEAATLPEGLLDQIFELGFSFMPVPEDLGGAGEGRGGRRDGQGEQRCADERAANGLPHLTTSMVGR